MAAVIAVIYARSSGYKLVEIGQERKKPYGENVAQLTANWSGRGRAAYTYRAILLPCVDTRVHVCVLCTCIYRVTRRDCISVKEPEEVRNDIVRRCLSKSLLVASFASSSLVSCFVLFSSYDCIVTALIHVDACIVQRINLYFIYSVAANELFGFISDFIFLSKIYAILSV